MPSRVNSSPHPSYGTPAALVRGSNWVNLTADSNTSTNAVRDGAITTTPAGDTGTTSFTVPANAVEIAKDMELLMPMRSALQADVVSSIDQFMSKPRISKTATWTTGSAAGSLLLSGTSWTETALDPVFANKIFGFSGLTYTTNLRVQVNASPFQQGRLRLSYYPNAVASPLKVIGHLQNRTSISQLPGIEMNVNDVSMELKIPFTSFQEYLDVVNSVNNVIDPVSWYLHVFSPLANGPNADRKSVV